MSGTRQATPAGGSGGEPAWVGDVLRFWLEDTSSEARFKKDAALDRAIKERFGALYEQLHVQPPAVGEMTPRSALATAIVLDQFPRNMFRGTARAFESDPVARELARAAVDAGLDQALDPEARLFLYLPFEHSEDLVDQARSVALIARLGDAKLDHYAVAHQVIIERFGRFPHRNAALGRVSTPEEEVFLKEPGSSF